jgi:Cu(I)/Ag(I) efflux system periplasmic protein CusF
MDRTRPAILLAALACLMSAASFGAAEESNALPMINGEVKNVDESSGKMTIKHGAITNLDMGAMTMVFKANNPAMLKNVKPSDKIKFSADKVNGQLTVMKVERVK